MQQENAILLEKLEDAEDARDEAVKSLKACEGKEQHLKDELASVRDKVRALQEKLKQDEQERIHKDSHMSVLREQNNSMLAMLEQEEEKTKQFNEKIAILEKKNRKLKTVQEEFDSAKADIEKQVATAKSKSADKIADTKSQRSLNETLRANIQNTEAKTRVDIEALGQALQVVDQRNMEYISRINKQESKAQMLQGDKAYFEGEIAKVRAEIDELRKQLEGDHEGRANFERQRSQVEMSIEALEVQADTLKKALSTAERANEQLQEENRTSAERSRETADKVYALMDSLRLNQVELKKQESENAAREKKVHQLERQAHNLSAKISMEVDAKVLAEQEKKEAEQESAVLKKKNKKIQEAVTQSQQTQEKIEKEIAETNEKVSEAQTQNAFYTSRIDSQDEEKNALKSEIKKAADRISEFTKENGELLDEIDGIEEKIASMSTDKNSLHKELEYIKREDVLDEAGRKRPILIQSTESDLLEKLQINEFLFEAQQARNPVPPMIEKVAQLLAMLHDAQQRSDQYLGDLSKSNGLVSALRQRNMQLYSETQMFESFKTRALSKYVMNLIEGELTSDMHLDSLSFGVREINEMLSLLERYDATDKVFVLTLVDNGLDDEAVNLLLQLIFKLPYIKMLDLRRNCISPEAVKKIQDQLKLMEGVTAVVPTANGVLNIQSGNQLRLSIDVSEQVAKEVLAKEVDFSVQPELNASDADPFLETNAGTSHHPWSKQNNNITQRSPQQAIPDPSAIDLQKPSAFPVREQPVAGGPPVGIGGPGNVASLNKKAGAGAAKGRDRLPDPKKRQQRRAKAAPPPALEYDPTLRQEKPQAPVQSSFEAAASSTMRRSASEAAPKTGNRTQVERRPPTSSGSASAQQHPLPAADRERRPGSRGGSRGPAAEAADAVRRATQMMASHGHGATMGRAGSMPTLRKPPPIAGGRRPPR